MFYGCIVRAITSVCAKDFVYFTQKNLLFLFYIITFTKHPHQFIYYTHFFIKIIFSLTFLLLFPTYPHLTFLFSLNNPFFFFFFFFFRLSLSLSPLYLCLSFFSIFFFFFENFFPSFSPSTHYKHSINTNLHQHLSPLSHHRSPSKSIHINPSPISINTDPTILFQWLIFFVDFVVDF